LVTVPVAFWDHEILEKQRQNAADSTPMQETGLKVEVDKLSM
jgi:hypothetical protein